MSETDVQQYGVSRLVAFCDGVFGFAITLLITTIPFSLGSLPSSASNIQVLQSLREVLPNVIAYVLSFFIVGNYWIIHHRVFRHIIKYDNTLLWINVILLLFIAFLPLPTAFLGHYGNNSLITALYAITQTIITFIYLIMGWYVSSRHLNLPSLNQNMIRYERLRTLLSVCLFALSIGLAFLNPQLAKFTWIAIFIIRPLVLRKYRYQEL